MRHHLSAPDPLIEAAREVLSRSHEEVRACVYGVSSEALNWRPAGPDSNSLAVLATHSLNSTRYWLSRALGAPPPPRDRPSEFRAEAADAEALLAFIDGMFGDCLALLDSAAAVDWSALREPPPALRPVAEEVTAAWALLHALEHIGEHAGQMLLTRQLWERRPQ